MLKIFDPSRQPLGRRHFLQIGGAALGGLTLPALAARALSAASGGGPVTGKSVVFLFMQGGPPQFETFDPKTQAPAAIGSVGGEIATSVPGVTFGSSLPKLARLAHRLAVVRSFQTGTEHGGLRPIVSETTGGASLGAVYSRIAGTNHPHTGLPTAMALWPVSVGADQPGPRTTFGHFDATGSLGAAYGPFTPGGGGQLQQDLKLGLSPEQFQSRQHLLSSLDRLRRQMDSSGALEGLDGMRQQAVDMLLKGVEQAFDLSREDPKTLARYDTSALLDPSWWTEPSGRLKSNDRWYRAHANTLGKLMLLARRLCEAGCGFITVNTEFVWDFHADGNNVGIEDGQRAVIDPFDHAVSAFIEDCEARGLSDQVLLVCCGEMGRTPRINSGGGRDHWPRLAPLMLYGGGLTGGQVVGQSTRDGAEPASDPLSPDHLLATIVRTLFDTGRVRLMPGLPRELLQAIERVDALQGVV